jgi:hypothetical protein
MAPKFARARPSIPDHNLNPTLTLTRLLKALTHSPAAFLNFPNFLLPLGIRVVIVR